VFRQRNGPRVTSTELRQTVLAQSRRIVVKLGTALLGGNDAAASGGVDPAFLSDIAAQIASLRQGGREVTLVSSGAIGAGCAILGLEKRPRDVAELQALAAVGQRRLMTRFHDAFAPHGLEVAQLLLTRGDFDDRARFLNVRNCLQRLHAHGCVPIVNENDTVAVDEIRFGDNDCLSALLCNAIGGDLLVLLTVVDGLMDRDGRRVDMVRDVQQANGLVRAEKTTWGTGGMASKLEAARLVAAAGRVAAIADGRQPQALPRLLDGESVGTVFLPRRRKMGARQRWIGLTRRPAGGVSIDAGALTALVRQNRSLLAIGITDVQGRFERGQVIAVLGPDRVEAARGLSNYSSEEIRLIMGRRSSQFEKILGRAGYGEVIHRDNLVVIGRDDADAPAPADA
jgi:glutamate 5-kinase